MPADLTPDAVRSRSFAKGRRGYDKGEVDQFVAEVADRIAAVETSLAQAEARLDQLGLKDAPALDVEFQRIGTDIADLLEAARKKAAEIRQRAREDVEHWEREATERVEALRGDIDTRGEQIVAEANAAAKSTLSQAEAGAAAVAAAAESEALAMRAEAEREAIRIVADARRHADEVRRSGSVEADHIVTQARTEADRIIEGALVGERPEPRTVDTAVEVTASEPERGPDDAVAEEPADQDDDPVDESPEDVDPSDSDKDDDPYPSSWPEDDGTVRIVPANRVLQDTGDIDADEMVAEIEMLRLSTIADDEPGEPALAVDVAEPEATDEVDESVVDVASEVDEDSGRPSDDSGRNESGATSDSEASEPQWEEAEAVPADIEAPSPENDVDGVEPDATEADVAGAGDDEEPTEIEDPASGEPEPEEPDSGSDGDVAVDIDGSSPVDDAVLDDADAVSGPQGEHADGSVLAVEDATDEASDHDSTPESEPASVNPDGDEPVAPVAGLDNLFALLRDGRGSDREPSGPIVADAPEMSEVAAADVGSNGDPEPVTERPDPSAVFEVRDRRLLPIENSALREVKRHLLELQNGTLDDLRVAKGDWSLDAAAFSAALTATVDALVAGAAESGWGAAVELTGHAPEGAVPAVIAVDDLASALTAAITDAYAMSAANDAGDREVSAAVSKVFRAWRTDEAERRVRRTAHAAYHDGLIAAMVAAGVPRVTVVTDGRPCPGCGAATSDASWRPSDPIPAWVQLPSTHIDCVATISPA